MTSPGSAGRTSVLLSFSEDHRAEARRVEQSLGAAGISTIMDPWLVTGTGNSSPRTDQSSTAVDVLVPLLTPAGDATGWLGRRWEQARLAPAFDAGIPVIPVRASPCVVPGMIAHLTFADLVYRDPKLETSKLLGAIRSATDDESISVPTIPSPQPAEEKSSFPAIQVALSDSLVDALGGDEGANAWETEALGFLRRGLYWELGLVLPPIAVTRDGKLDAMQAGFALHGVTESLIDVPPGRVFVGVKPAEAAAIDSDALPALNPESRGAAAWIRARYQAEAVAAGWRTLDAGGYLHAELASLLRRKAPTLLDTRLTAQLLRRIEPHYPRLIEETVPHPVPILLLTGILRRLLAEGVSIRDLRRILMVLGDWATREYEPPMLAEYVRSGLKRQLSHMMAGRKRELHVVLLDPAIEERISRQHKFMATASYIDLDADEVRHLIERISEPMNVFLKSGYQPPAILTVMGIRAPLQRLIAVSLPTIRVLSYQELLPDLAIQPVGRITDGPFSWRRGVTELNDLDLEQ